MCLACFVLITYIGGQERLYCNHEALNVAYDNPSAFCQVAGIVTYLQSSNDNAIYHTARKFYMEFAFMVL